MRTEAQKIARFGLLTALTLVLSLMDRAIPLSAFLSGVVPGIKLGLANTVLLYAIYMMNWQSALLLLLVKILMTGFFTMSATAVACSFAGGVLSLAVMLMIHRNAWIGAAAGQMLSAGTLIWLLIRNPNPAGGQLWTVILIGIAFAASTVLLIMTIRRKIRNIPGTSIAGGICHNIGQVAVVVLMLNTPGLLVTYLPFLIGIGAAVGCLTGIIAERVITILGNHGITGRAANEEKL